MSRALCAAPDFRQGLWAVILLLISTGALTAKDSIRLRDSRRIDGTVVSFDEDGVRLEGRDQILSWAEIESGKVSKDQEKFDKLVSELGLPLYRISLRMKRESYKDVLEPAEKLFPRYALRRSAAAYTVCQGLMWARISHGKRALAVEPYLICVDILRLPEHRKLKAPGRKQLKYDDKTGLTPELTPVWFDAAAAKAALPGAGKVAGEVADNLKPGANLYCATLALAAGENPAPFLEKVNSGNETVKELLQIIAVQKEVTAKKPDKAYAALEKDLPAMNKANKPLAYYWLGLAGILEKDIPKRKQAVLRLLTLAAIYEKTDPALAAASLHHSYQALEALPNAGSYAVGIGKLRTELLVRYPESHHARALKAALGKGSDEPSPDKK